MDITELLQRTSAGKKEVLDDVFSAIHDELYRIAESFMRRERAGHTLQATALVHEAYVRLVSQTAADVRTRTEFMRLAATKMKQILIDHGRKKNAARRPSPDRRQPFSSVHVAIHDRNVEGVMLGEALARLESLDSELANLIALGLVCGLGTSEIAEVTGQSQRVIQKKLRKAVMVLLTELDETA